MSEDCNCGSFAQRPADLTSSPVPDELVEALALLEQAGSCPAHCWQLANKAAELAISVGVTNAHSLLCSGSWPNLEALRDQLLARERR